MTTQKSAEAPACHLSPERLAMEVDVAVESRIEAINPAVAKLMRILRKTCCAPRDEFAVETALREALANAIIHGNRQDPTKRVHVRCGCEASGGVVIVVKDEGEGFDPASIPSPLTAELLDSDHGRGLYLISKMMDALHFEHEGREIHMRKYVLADH